MCGEKTARAITRPHVFGRGADLLIIENVPMMTCGNCGETYLTGDILKILEDILKNQASHVTRRMVRVAEFV